MKVRGRRQERRLTTVAFDADRLRTAMALRGLSGAKLAELTGCAVNTVSRAVNGQKIATQSARRIAEAIDAAPIIAGLAGILAA